MKFESHANSLEPVLGTINGSGRLMVLGDSDVMTQLQHYLQGLDCQIMPWTHPLDHEHVHPDSAWDILILDGAYDGGKSYDICRKLRQQSQYQSLPILMAIDPNQSDELSQVFQAGATDYLRKPLEAQETLIRVKQQLTLLAMKRRLFYQQRSQLTQSGKTMNLLVSLQRKLHLQSEILHEKNLRLKQEIVERHQVELALRKAQSKSEQLLLNILPKTIADRLKQEELVLADRFEEATILFADIVDFTPLSSQLSPLDLVALLNDIFSSFDGLVDRYGLEKIKTIGDAYMVAGGVPTYRPDHAEAIMELAIAMHHDIRRFKQRWNLKLRLRIGINTGTVVAGVIGIRKFTYDLWGDAVNVASRMESQGLPGRIQVTDSTYGHLKHLYDFEEWGVVNVKGKGKMTTYFVIGRKSS